MCVRRKERESKNDVIFMISENKRCNKNKNIFATFKSEIVFISVLIMASITFVN